MPISPRLGKASNKALEAKEATAALKAGTHRRKPTHKSKVKLNVKKPKSRDVLWKTHWVA